MGTKDLSYKRNLKFQPSVGKVMGTDCRSVKLCDGIILLPHPKDLVRLTKPKRCYRNSNGRFFTINHKALT